MTGGDREEDGKEDKLPTRRSRGAEPSAGLTLEADGFRLTHHKGDRCHVTAKI